MRAFITLFAVFLLILHVNGQLEKDAHIQKKIQECFDDTNVPPELRRNNPMGLLEDPRLKCFSACMMKKKGTMKDGKMNLENQLMTMQPESKDKIKEIISTCSSTANLQNDECEVAHVYVSCLIKNINFQG